MTISTCVRSKTTNILPQNRCLVALLFKDGGGLANHPLSCHPQGVFSSRENERKEKKMRERKSSGKTPAHKLYIQQRKNENPSTRFDLSLYSAQISKNTKIPSIPIIHEGKNWKKITKKKSNRGQKGKKNHKCRSNFCTLGKFRRVRNIRSLPKFYALHFLCLFYSSFLLISDL